MPVHMSTFQLLGVPVLALATALWIICVGRVVGRRRMELAARRRYARIQAFPRQRRTGPALESVELTPAEHAAFAGLMRQFDEGRTS
ncbi:hypothetical protein AB0C59_33015 [Streptomyces sp. NPDC048664]|uniref:hypothetical protein n=1 Tax=Streptomyces sp. NPDC048664 TaxID=3154505 RepID=UPI00342A99BF